jgi:hypothetical protein
MEKRGRPFQKVILQDLSVFIFKDGAVDDVTAMP